VQRLRGHGITISVRTLFDAPTPAALAAAEGDTTIAPDTPLITLTQEQRDQIAAHVPGGAANIADIYPLAPLQEGIFFHHLMADQHKADAYVLPSLLRLDSRERLDEFLAALQQVVNRHDIFRTSLAWHALPEPVQVVWRHADLPVTELPPGTDLTSAAGNRMDLSRAPLMDVHHTTEPATGKHLALIRVHHLTVDHTALDVVLGEIAALLPSADAGDTLPTPLPFRDFVAQARLGTPKAEHERHFAALLADVTEPTVAFGAADVHGDGTGADEARAAVGAEVAARIRDCARSFGVSPATVWHLIWARVLATASGSDDVVFGTVLFGRMNSGAGADRVPGPFINTLPVRIATGEASAADTLTALRSQLAGLLAHEHAPLSLAQQASQITPPAPLFTTLLNYRHTAAGPRGGRAMAGVELLSGRERTNYPVSVSVDDTGTDFVVTILAVAPADAHLIQRLVLSAADGMARVLHNTPDLPVHRAPLLTPAERAHILTRWNDTEAPLPDGTLNSLFAATADHRPDATAVLCGDQHLSFQALDERASRLADVLAEHGAGPRTAVAVMMGRSATLVTTLLAVVKAGAAYLPVHPGTPPERAAFMLADAEAVLVVTDRAAQGHVPEGAIAVVIADDVRGAGGRPAHTTGPDELAYLMYTSGSTGRPKGVAVRHRDVVALAADRGWQDRHERVLLHSPTAFDASTYELWVPLLNGGTVVVAEADHLDSGDLRTLIDRGAVTAAFFTTALFNAVAAQDPAALSGLRVVLTGGEMASAGAMRTMLSACPGLLLGHVYGP
ncbi:MAG TPA: AMP-binding protein, partial [Streptosporangiaceae bacterium]|nr:AMP-binding protein [Streptosporangiaceae bacterium]